MPPAAASCWWAATRPSCDITKASGVHHLVAQGQAEFGGRSVLINNAGEAATCQLGTGAEAFAKA